MRVHSANELLYRAYILAADGKTIVTSGIPCGVSDVTGRRDEQAQLSASVTQHTIVMRYADAASLTASSYVLCDDVLYVVDFTEDPRKPRPKMWLDVFCHVERSGN